jgi:FtsP/CotA-like multicopper oxidase with cupredoxin domain
MRICVALVSVLVVSSAFAQTSLQPPNWKADLALAEAPDLNPDPHILEINLEARVQDVEYEPGKRVAAWTYNGGLPGPFLRLRVGDRLIVHFTNTLPQATTVHWHGLRVPIKMDGVPGASQPDVKPGESFTYDFTVPDAGLFWYHPHVMSAAQVGFGLYGPLLVEDPTENVGVADELVMVLSDIAIGEDGTFEPPDSGGTTGMAFGRQGTHVLVNGRTAPALRIRSGAPQRWRIVNAAKSRYFLLDLPGVTFTKIGGDGGLQASPVESKQLLLATGERADVIVRPTLTPGTEVLLESLLHNRGYGSVEFQNISTLLRIAVSDVPPVIVEPAPPVRRTIEPIDTAGATHVTVNLTIDQDPSDGSLAYGINGVPFAKDHPLRARPGDTQVWTVKNTTKWSHPFHIHGFFFQVLDEKGAHVQPLEWKDTVNVPFEQTVRLVVRFDEREGDWMYHCHILDHADGGLMGTVRVGTPEAEHAHPAAP